MSTSTVTTKKVLTLNLKGIVVSQEPVTQKLKVTFELLYSNDNPDSTKVQTHTSVKYELSQEFQNVIDFLLKLNLVEVNHDLLNSMKHFENEAKYSTDKSMSFWYQSDTIQIYRLINLIPFIVTIDQPIQTNVSEYNQIINKAFKPVLLDWLPS
jgi:hypothetical protein